MDESVLLRQLSDHERMIGGLEAQSESLGSSMKEVFERLEDLQQRGIENRERLTSIFQILERISRKIDDLCKSGLERSKEADEKWSRYSPFLDMMITKDREKKNTWIYVRRGTYMIIVSGVLLLLWKAWMYIPNIQSISRP